MTSREADLLGIATEVNAAESEDEIVRIVVRRVGEVIPHDRAAVALADPERRELRLRDVAVEGSVETPKVRRIPLERSNLVGWVALEKEPHLRRSLAESDGFETQQRDREAESHILAPLLAREGECLGVLTLGSYEEAAFDAGDVELFRRYARLTGVALDNLRNYRRASALAVVDGLTGAYNHRHFRERLEEEMDRVERYGDQLSLLMLDIDRFKDFNDEFGHQAGDEVLQQTVDILKTEVRSTDQVFRYGGEEFAVLMPSTGAEGAAAVAGKLLAAVRHRNRFRATREREVRVTLSAGCASAPGDADHPEGLVACADQALYRSKVGGRDRHTVFSRMEGVRELDRSLLSESAASSGESDFSPVPPSPDHSRRVEELCAALAERVGLAEDRRLSLRIAAAYHDLGEVGIPRQVLEKEGGLDERERRIVETHPVVGEKLLQRTIRMEEVLEGVLYHHERYDGRGYPEGIEGEKIPYLARIIAVAETFDALVTPRPYREPLPLEEAYRELRDAAGYQLDPELVDEFIASGIGERILEAEG